MSTRSVLFQSSLITFSFLNFADLKDMFRLLKRSEDLARLVNDYLMEHLERSFGHIRAPCDDSQVCDALASRYYEEKETVDNIFFGRHGSCRALEEAFFDVVNRTSDPDSNSQFSPMQEVARYCDRFLGVGERIPDEKEVSDNIETVLLICDFFRDRDLFCKFYTIRLTMRLVRYTSLSLDAEENMLNRIRAKAGKVCEQEIERMTSGFISDKQNSPLPFPLDIRTLRTEWWSARESKVEIRVPQELEEAIQLFNDFYCNSRPNRKLTWNQSFGTFEINMNINDQISATFADIASATEMDTSDLIGYMQYLVGQQIFVCQDNEDVTERSAFSLNEEFESSRDAIKLTPDFEEPAREKRKEEKERVVKAVLEHRKVILKALIVRIVKGRKRVTREDLAREVVQQTAPDFVPSEASIADVIRGLMHKEYMRAVEGASDVEYEYIA